MRNSRTPSQPDATGYIKFCLRSHRNAAFRREGEVFSACLGEGAWRDSNDVAIERQLLYILRQLLPPELPAEREADGARSDLTGED